MARFLCMPHWTRRLAASTEKLRRATLATTSWPSWKKWCRCARRGSRFISFWTTSPLIKRNWFAISCKGIPVCNCTSRPPILPGSTKSNCGSPKSSAKSLPAASSPQSPIWLASSAATSTPIRQTLVPFSGNTPTLLAAYAVTNSLRQSPSIHTAPWQIGPRPRSRNCTVRAKSSMLLGAKPKLNDRKDDRPQKI